MLPSGVLLRNSQHKVRDPLGWMMRGEEHLSYEDRLLLKSSVPTEEEKALERPYSTFQYLKGLQESWRGSFYKGKKEWL